MEPFHDRAQRADVSAA